MACRCTGVVEDLHRFGGYRSTGRLGPEHDRRLDGPAAVGLVHGQEVAARAGDRPGAVPAAPSSRRSRTLPKPMAAATASSTVTWASPRRAAAGAITSVGADGIERHRVGHA